LSQRRLADLFPNFLLFNAPAPTQIYTLSLHDALPISAPSRFVGENRRLLAPQQRIRALPERQDRRLIQDVAELLLERQPDVVLRSEEHTSELQSLAYLVCRLLLEKKKQQQIEQLV